MNRHVAVPRCGQLGCRDQELHTHPMATPGMRVVLEPKHPTAPGWVWSCPHATVIEPAQPLPDDRLLIQTDDGVIWNVARSLATKYHTWRRRKAPTPRPKLLPQLGRQHVITTPGVVEPTLFGE